MVASCCGKEGTQPEAHGPVSGWRVGRSAHLGPGLLLSTLWGHEGCPASDRQSQVGWLAGWLAAVVAACVWVVVLCQHHLYALHWFPAQQRIN